MPYGTVNADVIQSSVANTSLGAGNASIMKNRIINGAMMVAQRGTSAVTQNASDYLYPVDRFGVFGSVTSKFTAQQSSTAPAGFINSIIITSSSAYTVGAAESFVLQQFIEGLNVADLGWGTADAKTVTLSFWVRSSLTGTFGGSLANASVSRSYPFSYTISAANTWQQVSVTIAGDTTGTWLTTNGLGIRVWFSMGSGSSFSGTAGSWAGADYRSATGATSVVGTNGATFYITGVQLEVGSSATGYEYRQYQQELALCQRYYYLYCSGADKSINIGTYYSSTAMYTSFQTPVTMRTTPTLASTTGTGFYAIYRNGVTDDFNSLSLDGYQHTNGVILQNSTETSGTAGQSGFVATRLSGASLALSAEL